MKKSFKLIVYKNWHCPKVTGFRVIARSETTWRSLTEEISFIY